MLSPRGYRRARVFGILAVAALSLAGSLSFAATGGSARDLASAREAAIAASKAYEEGNFARAIELYEEAIASGLDHPVLDYDLGNAYYKKGDLGRAILWYERARRNAPRDRAIAHNLAQARSQMQDQEISTHLAPMLLRPVSWVRDQLSLNGWSTLVLISLLVVVVTGVWRQWSTDRRSLTRRILELSMALTLLSATMTLSLYRSQYWSQRAVVVAEKAEVRSGPGADYDLAFRIHAGLIVNVDQSRGEWVRIDLGGDLVGWVLTESLEDL